MSVQSPIRPLSALAAIILLGAPSATIAQNPVTRARRDSTQRRDTAAALLRPIAVRASIVPAAGPTIGSGVPARVSVLTSRQIDAWEPRLLPDALAMKPGVSLYDDLGSSRKLNLSTRGFTAGPTVGLPSGVTVFLDGVRQNEPDAQEVNFDLLPLDHVERVEMLSGSASLLGPNSLGGAINLVTARGEGPPSGELEISAGSFGQASAEARAGGRTAEGTDYFVAGNVGREEGWRDATAARDYGLLANVGRAGTARGLTMQVYGARSRAESAGSLPESMFASSPRSNFTVGDFDDLSVQQLALSGYRPVAGGRGELSSYMRRSSAERFNVNQAPDPNVRSRTSNVSVGGTADWRRTFLLGAGALAVRGGLDGAINRVNVRIFTESTGAGTDTSTLTTDVESPSVDLAGYALADYQVGRFTFSGGGRHDFVRVPFRNMVRPADNTTNDYRSFSPRLGASMQLAPGVSLYASAGRSFRAPAILELGCADPEATCPLPFALGDDPPLRPLRATTYEAGGQWARGALIASASAYRTEVRDEIFFVASEQASLSGYFTNLDRTRREGLELGIQGMAADERLSWYGNYAYTRATFQSAVELFSTRSDSGFAGSPYAGPNDVKPGDRLPLVPANQVKGGVLARLGAGLSLGLDARWFGQQWLRGDEANETSPLDAYATLNARVGYARGRWEAAAIVTNVTDLHAASFGTYGVNRQRGALERFLTPLNGRGVRFTIRRAFGFTREDAEEQ